MEKMKQNPSRSGQAAPRLARGRSGRAPTEGHRHAAPTKACSRPAKGSEREQTLPSQKGTRPAASRSGPLLSPPPKDAKHNHSQHANRDTNRDGPMP